MMMRQRVRGGVRRRSRRSLIRRLKRRLSQKHKGTNRCQQLLVKRRKIKKRGNLVKSLKSQKKMPKWQCKKKVMINK